MFQQYLFHGPGLHQLGWYALTAALACVGYGSVFLLTGVIYPQSHDPGRGGVRLGEPEPFPALAAKKFSIVFYLKSLCPVGESRPMVLWRS